MSARVIEWNLEQDVIDRTAADVMTANPGMFATTADVPDFLFKSLKTIWLGAPAASGALADAVISDLRTKTNDSAGAITVIADRVFESVEGRFFESDQMGAETARMVIQLTRPRNTTSVTIIRDACLRVKYILDEGSRGLRRLPPQLPIRTDNTLDASFGLYARFDEFIGPLRTDIEEIIFTCEYVRVFAV